MISNILVVALLNLIGCYYQEQMNPSEYSFDEYETVKITTKDSVYNFKVNEYSLVNDTLIAKFSKKLDLRRTLQSKVEIPIEDIESVEIDRIDALPTILIGLGVVVGVLAILAILTFDVDIKLGPQKN